jgi:presenilin-like A22 family membrane protease
VNDVTETDQFKARPVYLLPILASLLAGLVFSFVLLSSNIGTLPVTPFPETPSGQFSNALYFVILIAIAATIFYLLIKYRSRRMITVLIGFAMTAASVLLSAFYSIALLSSLPNWEIYVVIICAVVTVVFDFVIFKGNETSRNFVVVLLGGALGVFLGWSIPVVSAILILAFLAVYDIIAVYKGPVGKIASSGLDQLRGLSFSFKDIQMGLGDLVFYSMLCAVMLLNSDFGGILPYIGSLLGVVGGSFITFRILEKRGIFPGLPVPIFLGIVCGFLGAFIATL